MHTFVNLTVDKTGATQRVVLTFGRARIEFLLDPRAGKGKASFPISKGKQSDSIIETSHPRGEKDSERQILFELLLHTLAALHPQNIVPNIFRANDGKIYKLDKTAAVWALDGSKFERAEDEFGIQSIRPT